MIPATTLAETIAALETRVAEAKEWVARQVAWKTAYRLAQEAKDRAEKAEADNARLRQVIRDASASETFDEGDGYMASISVCPWCGSDDLPTHGKDCAAFTIDGVVR